MKPFRFQLDGSPVWSGYTTGETWNGFAVPWVTPETREAIAAWIAAQPGDGLENVATAGELRALQPTRRFSSDLLVKLDLGLTFAEAPGGNDESET